MFCPECGVQLADDAKFCTGCGAKQAAEAVQAAATPPPVPPAQVPAPPVPQVPASAPQQYPGMTPMPSAAPPPPPPSKAPMIAIVSIVAVVAVAAAGFGAWFFLLRDTTEDPPQTDTVQTPADIPAGTSTPADGVDAGDPGAAPGFATIEEAALGELEEDWVHQVVEETTDRAVVWVGPPASEWVWEYTVERGDDGLWRLTGVADVPYGDEGDDADIAAEEAAITVVHDFLMAIMNDQLDDAGAMATDYYFREGPANVFYTEGDFLSFSLVTIETNGSGGHWVTITEDWVWGPETFSYEVIETDQGLKVNDWRAE